MIELYDAVSVSAVPQPVVKLFAVWSLIVDKKHIFLCAPYIRDHPVKKVPLLHMPHDLLIGFMAVESRTGKCPEF